MKRTSLLLTLAVALIAAAATLPPARVTITLRGNSRSIESNGLPNHAPGEFPRRGNPNTISAQDYHLSVPTNPQLAAQPTPSRRALFGVALNGVPFEPGTAEVWNGDHSSGWRYEALSGKIDLGLDNHLAHVQPNGAYHYHGLPKGLIESLGGDGKTMRLIGYAADGFPIYTAYDHADPKNATSSLRVMRSSYQLRSGNRSGGPGGKFDGTFTEDYEYIAGSGDLDDCHGRLGVTPEYPEGIYHYCVTHEFPQLSRQWRGTPDPSFEKKGPPPSSGMGNGHRPPPNARPDDLFLPRLPF